jgi:hypothetical protein
MIYSVLLSFSTFSYSSYGRASPYAFDYATIPTGLDSASNHPLVGTSASAWLGRGRDGSGGGLMEHIMGGSVRDLSDSVGGVRDDSGGGDFCGVGMSIRASNLYHGGSSGGSGYTSSENPCETSALLGGGSGGFGGAGSGKYSGSGRFRDRSSDRIRSNSDVSLASG